MTLSILLSVSTTLRLLLSSSIRIRFDGRWYSVLLEGLEKQKTSIREDADHQDDDEISSPPIRFIMMMILVSGIAVVAVMMELDQKEADGTGEDQSAIIIWQRDYSKKSSEPK